MPRMRSDQAARRLKARGLLGDALVACGATLVLLAAPTRAAFPIVGGFALILVGAGLLWGVPPPPVRVRMMAGVAGLLIGFWAFRAL